ncbi:hypothetical protein QL285_081593 [Trifolium repens]|nr:hypothetical protein QL285_081593 [Trifolium repens]
MLSEMYRFVVKTVVGNQYYAYVVCCVKSCFGWKLSKTSFAVAVMKKTSPVLVWSPSDQMVAQRRVGRQPSPWAWKF